MLAWGDLLTMTQAFDKFKTDEEQALREIGLIITTNKPATLPVAKNSHLSSGLQQLRRQLDDFLHWQIFGERLAANENAEADDNNVKPFVEQNGKTVFSCEFLDLAERVKMFALERGLRFVETDESTIRAIEDFKKLIEVPLGDEVEVEAMQISEIAKIDHFYKYVFNLYFRKVGTVKEARKILSSVNYLKGLNVVITPLMDLLDELGRGEGTHVVDGSRDSSEGISGRSDVHEVSKYAELWRACENAKSFIYYAIQERQQIYHGGQITADFFAKLLGMPSVSSLFRQEDGSPKTIVDLGCADGRLLINLAKAKRTEERAHNLNAYAIKILKDLNFVNESKITKEQIWRLDAKLLEFLIRNSTNIPLSHEPTDPHLIGVDMSATALNRLKHAEIGLSTLNANIAIPGLAHQDPLQAEKTDIVVTSLTTDRVENLDQLLANIAELLAKDGHFVIVTTCIIDPKSDGKNAQNPIFYSSSQKYRAESAVGTSSKLIDGLKAQGLAVDGLSIIPYHVKSSSGAQDYSLLVLTGRKSNTNI